ncbi:MAG: hypothetical protein U9P42_08985, partial [Candidatus Fermentibacteria bacterium]|nr:hypothetical protein [Candidatus Fermentibacteria bacterium]
ADPFESASCAASLSTQPPIANSTRTAASTNGSASDAEAVDNNTETSEPAETASSSSEDSENDSVPADINYDNYDAGIPDGFPDVIPVYDIANSTVMGGMEQDAGRTMMYSLVLGSNDEISDISETIINSLENIDLNIADESSALLIGYMGDWDYTITVNNGEADGFVAVITYSIVEKE